MRISDWSSDVCSSDLHALPDLDRQCRNNCQTQPPQEWHPRERQPKGERQRGETQQMMQLVLLIEQPRYRFRLHAVDRESVGEGKRVSVRGDTGGRRISKKKLHEKIQIH